MFILGDQLAKDISEYLHLDNQQYKNQIILTEKEIKERENKLQSLEPDSIYVKKLVRKVAEEITKIPEAKKDSIYTIEWVTILNSNQSHHANVFFKDKNNNAKPDSLDELEINSYIRDHADIRNNSHEIYVDKKIDGIPEKGEKVKYKNILEYILKYIILDYKEN